MYVSLQIKMAMFLSLRRLRNLERTLGCGHNKVIRLKRAGGLWVNEEIKQGLNRPNKIYVGNLEGTSIQKMCF